MKLFWPFARAATAFLLCLPAAQAFARYENTLPEGVVSVELKSDNFRHGAFTDRGESIGYGEWFLKNRGLGGVSDGGAAIEEQNSGARVMYGLPAGFTLTFDAGFSSIRRESDATFEATSDSTEDANIPDDDELREIASSASSSGPSHFRLGFIYEIYNDYNLNITGGLSYSHADENLEGIPVNYLPRSHLRGRVEGEIHLTYYNIFANFIHGYSLESTSPTTASGTYENGDTVEYARSSETFIRAFIERPGESFDFGGEFLVTNDGGVIIDGETVQMPYNQYNLGGYVRWQNLSGASENSWFPFELRLGFQKTLFGINAPDEFGLELSFRSFFKP